MESRIKTWGYFILKVVKNGHIIKGYKKYFEFVPILGMSFKENENYFPVQEVIYDLKKYCFYCLSEIDYELPSTSMEEVTPDEIKELTFNHQLAKCVATKRPY